MLLHWGMAPPVTIGGQVLIGSLGFALALALAACLRGRIPTAASCLGLCSVWLGVLGLGVAGFGDPRGILTFLLGAVGGAVAGRFGTAGTLRGKPRPATIGLVLTAPLVGMAIGFVTFCVWYWQASRVERMEDTVKKLCFFEGFGVFSGIVAAAVVVLAAGLPGKQRGIPEVEAGPPEATVPANRPDMREPR